jgi:hypothetical protein
VPSCEVAQSRVYMQLPSHERCLDRIRRRFPLWVDHGRPGYIIYRRPNHCKVVVTWNKQESANNHPPYFELGWLINPSDVE